jgi:BlaI family transcriptional regulator, penicillinase repressor
MTRTTRTKPLTPLELEIMRSLWELGGGTVQQVQEHLAIANKLAYTTVQTMLTVLHRKGVVKRRLVGKAYQYSPAISEGAARTTAARDLVRRFFEGSAQQLVMELVRSKDLSPEKLAELARELEKQEEQG